MDPAPRLRTNIAANVFTALTALAVGAVSTPLILDELGRAEFGVWTVVASLVLYLAIAESGFGPAVQRFVAVSHGQQERHVAARLMWTVLLLYLLLGSLVCGVLQLLAQDIIGVFDFPARLHDDAVDLLRVVAAAVPVSLLAAGLGNVLFGLERFVVNAISAALGALVLLGTIIALVATEAGLADLGIALLAQQAVMLLVRSVAVRELIFAGRPTLATRRELREMASFSARLQVAALSLLINGQSDKVVVGVVAPATTVAQLGVGAQVAESGRLVGGAMLQPIISRFAVVMGAGGGAGLADEYRRLSRLWFVLMIGATAVGVGSLHPLLVSWLGSGYETAFALGSVLIVAYALNLSTGIASAYLRASGRIGIESRAGALTVALNIAFTIPLAILAGAAGVVIGTLVAYAVGTAWFFLRVHTVIPARAIEDWRPLVTQAGLAIAAGAIAFGLGSAANAALPRFAAIAPVAISAGLAFGGYLAACLRVPLRPGVLRALARSISSGDGTTRRSSS